jgi:hypothetical protein
LSVIWAFSFAWETPSRLFVLTVDSPDLKSYSLERGGSSQSKSKAIKRIFLQNEVAPVESAVEPFARIGSTATVDG